MEAAVQEDPDKFGAERRAIAERLFEVMRIPHRSAYHFRRRVKRWLEGDEYTTLCGRTATEAIPVHHTDRPCNDCLAAAQGIVDETINQEFHEAMNLPGNVGSRAPLAQPDEVEKRAGWLTGGRKRA